MPETLSELTAICPIDGRYWEDVRELADCTSESALIKNRMRIEIEYLLALGGIGITTFSETERTTLVKSYQDISNADVQLIKHIETKGVIGINGGKKTGHDVKAVELFLRNCFKGTSLEDRLELFHICLTSEDVNNIAYTLMLRDAVHKHLVPSMLKLEQKILAMAEDNIYLAMPGRTHGQYAVPTTVGKELLVFADRIATQLDDLCKIKLKGKLNGAVGNYNAFFATYPAIDWEAFSKKFVESFGLEHNPLTTQIEPHDTMTDLFFKIVHMNDILLGTNQDMWSYISDEYFVQKREEGEVGSSTMPQKINPISYENSEANLGIANALLVHLARKLSVSRFQRDLSDSAACRWIGTALGASLLAYKNTLRGLNKTEPYKAKLERELDTHWEMLAEPIQQILRREGISGAYDILKSQTQGKQWSKKDIEEFVNKADIADSIKAEILALSPQTYFGIAPKLVSDSILRVREVIGCAERLYK